MFPWLHKRSVLLITVKGDQRRNVHVAVSVRFTTCESFYHTTLRLLRLDTMATRYQSADEARGHQQGSLSGPALSIVSSNIEDLTCAKQDLLAELCTRNNCDILCLQETHRGPSRNRPRIPGMTLITERLHDQYGSAIFVRNGLTVDNASVSENDNIEVLSIELMGISVSSVYKPPIETFSLPNAVTDGRVNVVIGDFNSHSVTWGYGETNEDGESVENWADANQMSLIHDAKLPYSFNSCRWRRGYNPDLMFVSNNIAKDTDSYIQDLPALPTHYDTFVEMIKRSSRRNIPRGCRTTYTPGLTDDSKVLYNDYEKHFQCDPFSADTLECGENLTKAITESRRKKWQELIQSTDITHSSRKAWKTIRMLGNDQTKAQPRPLVTANQVAHQLLVNSRGEPRPPFEKSQAPKSR